MNYFTFVLVLLGWLLLLFALSAIFCALVAAIIAAVIGLFFKCCPLTALPHNPDVIPQVPPARNLLGG